MPDLSESPYSSYKSACRLVAITTFKHALGMDSYAFVAVDTTAVNETEVVIRIYNHFMHHLQRSLRAKENLNPWSVKKKKGPPQYYIPTSKVGSCVRNEDTLRYYLTVQPTIYSLQWHIPNIFANTTNARRYRMLVCDSRANSDDELNPQGGHYVIKRRTERSIQAETFFRSLDDLCRRVI